MGDRQQTLDAHEYRKKCKALEKQVADDEDLLWRCLVRLEFDGAMGPVYRAVRARLEGEDEEDEDRDPTS